MTLKRNAPFERHHLDSKKEVLSIKWTGEYREMLDKCKLILEQEKDGTAIKQVFQMGAKVLLDDKTTHLLGLIFDNKRKNKRLGIIEFD